MGKKRIVKTKEGAAEGEAAKSGARASTKKRLDAGVLHVQSTYNNTIVVLTDTKGNAVCSASSGSLGFKGAKKGTPFAAAKVGEAIAAKASTLGLKEVSIIVKGVGSGRESAMRSFASKGFSIVSINDATPVPHNGTRPPRARRV